MGSEEIWWWGGLRWRDLRDTNVYSFTETVAARLGYRTVGWKYKGDNNDDNELNISLSGLIVGLGVTF